MSGRSPVYHLAWHRRYVSGCERFHVYVLVPEWLGAFRGSIDFEVISTSGRPLDKLRATMNDLASPRRREDTEGVAHPLEFQLIRMLGIRAAQASHILPRISPSVIFRSWSRLELSEEQRNRLILAGGVSPERKKGWP